MSAVMAGRLSRYRQGIDYREFEDGTVLPITSSRQEHADSSISRY